MNAKPLQLQLPRFQTARVWINELPTAALFKAHSVLTKQVEGGQIAPSVIINAAAIEWLVPLGPRTAYGLLGGRILSDDRASFEVEIASSVGDGPKYEDALSSKVSDDARIGLPAEYGQAVLDAAVSTLQQLDHPVSGRLVVDYAVHGLVGSSSVMFARLGAILVELLCSAKIPDRRLLEQILVWK